MATQANLGFAICASWTQSTCQGILLLIQHIFGANILPWCYSTGRWGAISHSTISKARRSNPRPQCARYLRCTSSIEVWPSQLTTHLAI